MKAMNYDSRPSEPRSRLGYATTYRTNCVMVLQDKFSYQPRAGWKRVQRACFWLLSKIGAFAEETIETVTWTTKQSTGIAERLFGQQGQMIDLLNREPCRIICGPDTSADLYDLCMATGMRPMDLLPARTSTTGWSSSMKWHDIPIYVVPWISGAVIIPDSALQ